MSTFNDKCKPFDELRKKINPILLAESQTKADIIIKQILDRERKQAEKQLYLKI